MCDIEKLKEITNQKYYIGKPVVVKVNILGNNLERGYVAEPCIIEKRGNRKFTYIRVKKFSDLDNTYSFISNRIENNHFILKDIIFTDEELAIVEKVKKEK